MIPYGLLYRLGIVPWENTPGPQLFDRVLSGATSGPGRRALDVGCGTGRDAIHLAKQGWDVTAVDLETHALRQARERAAAEGVKVHWIQGDITDLGALGAQPGYSLIYDMGCIHGLDDRAAARAASGISSLAADRATLLLLAFARARRVLLPRGMNREQVEALFASAWRIKDAYDMIPLSTKVPPPIRKARPTVYHLVRA